MMVAIVVSLKLNLTLPALSMVVNVSCARTKGFSLLTLAAAS